MHPSLYSAIFLIAVCTISARAQGPLDVETPTPKPIPTAAISSCKNPNTSPLSRFWDLEPGSNCGTFAIRGYKPISLAVVGSDGVNTAPTSPAPDHTAVYQPYNASETRIQLSVRTKVAEGLFTLGSPERLDSVWFGYSQQSYWQLFNKDLSRPFRATDHEPEITYIFPIDMVIGKGWRLRYVGASANHQSNGQSLPQSRSWNRVIAKAGMEYGNTFLLNANLWQRMPEDAATDDNPDIADLVGRAEVSGIWYVSDRHTLGATVRHSLKADANGSVRLTWWNKLASSNVEDRNGLRFFTEVFSGYGDSLMDYNRRRTVLSMGLTLLDW
jgi:phospholipase A1